MPFAVLIHNKKFNGLAFIPVQHLNPAKSLNDAKSKVTQSQEADMKTYHLNKEQRELLLKAHSFLIRSGSFHLGNSFLKIIHSGYIKDIITVYSIRMILYCIISPFLVEKYFPISKEIKR